MIIGLSFLAQIQDEWAKKSLKSIVAAITKGYGTQHNSNDTHSTITATGSVSERNRLTAMGVWQNVMFAATLFSSSPLGSWRVAAANQQELSYMLVGTTMTVSFYLESSQIITTAPTYLTLTVPANAIATRQQSGTFSYDDNGTRGTGIAIVVPTNTASAVQIRLMKDMRGATTWTVSSACSLRGQFAFEVSGV